MNKFCVWKIKLAWPANKKTDCLQHRFFFWTNNNQTTPKTKTCKNKISAQLCVFLCNLKKMADQIYGRRQKTTTQLRDPKHAAALDSYRKSSVEHSYGAGVQQKQQLQHDMLVQRQKLRLPREALQDNTHTMPQPRGRFSSFGKSSRGTTDNGQKPRALPRATQQQRQQHQQHQQQQQKNAHTLRDEPQSVSIDEPRFQIYYSVSNVRSKESAIAVLEYLQKYFSERLIQRCLQAIDVDQEHALVPLVRNAFIKSKQLREQIQQSCVLLDRAESVLLSPNLQQISNILQRHCEYIASQSSADAIEDQSGAKPIRTEAAPTAQRKLPQTGSTRMDRPVWAHDSPKKAPMTPQEQHRQQYEKNMQFTSNNDVAKPPRGLAHAIDAHAGENAITVPQKSSTVNSKMFATGATTSQLLEQMGVDANDPKQTVVLPKRTVQQPERMKLADNGAEVDALMSQRTASNLYDKGTKTLPFGDDQNVLAAEAAAYNRKNPVTKQIQVSDNSSSSASSGNRQRLRTQQQQTLHRTNLPQRKNPQAHLQHMQGL